MGILNVTPDSFSDGGRYHEKDAAVAHALEMAHEGADIIDIGGESSRPGAESVSAQEECRRVLPVIETIKSRRPDLCLSIDTVKAQVADAAIKAGAEIVNDISGLCSDPQMLPLLAQSDAGCVMMHMRGTPATMQDNPEYGDVVAEIIDYLKQRIEKAQDAGIDAERICLDPGIGFGKRIEHNLQILSRFDEFCALGRPLLVGVSRKSFIGKILDETPDNRLEGSIAAGVAAVMRGASVVRVHDVGPMKRALAVVDAIRRGIYQKEQSPR